MSEEQALFEEDVTACRVAQSHEAAATAVEAEALHAASATARESGLSVRAAARDLRVTHSRLQRARRPVGQERLVHLAEARRVVAVADGAEGWPSRVEWFARARARAEALRLERGRVLRMALVDGTEGLGLSIRKTAARLGVSHATAARALLTDQVPLPVWADEESMLAVQRLVWAHAPHRPEFLEERVPYEWVDHADGSRGVRLVSVGVARLRREGE